MSHLMKSLAVVITALTILATAVVLAHETTVKGTVAGIEVKRIQVKTGEEKKTEAPASYPIDAKTRPARAMRPIPSSAPQRC